MVEQRKSQRRVFRAPVVVAMATGQTFPARSYDLAAGGMAIVTDVQLEVACPCVLGFDLSLGERIEKLRLPSRLVYCQPCAEGFKSGLQFLDPDEASSAILSDHLNGAATST